MKHNYYTMTQDDDYWNVYGWSVYESSSVLAGQPRKMFLESCETLEEVKKNYPGVTYSNSRVEPKASVGPAPPNYYASDGGFYNAGEYWDEDDY